MSLDPITLEVLQTRFAEIVATMEHLLFHSGYSTILRESYDGSCVLTDPAGHPFQAGLPIHLTPYHLTVQGILKQYPLDTMREGDCFIANDPYLTGVYHPSDIALITPVFYHDRMIGFSASIAHKSDIGGMVPGSASGSAREIFHEGTLIPGVRYWGPDGVVAEVERMLLRNSRQPETVLGDLHAQLGCTRVGAEKLRALCDEYGVDAVVEASQRLQELCEARVRRGLAAWPDGEHEAETSFEPDGAVTFEPVRFHVRVRKRGDSIEFDYTGSSPQTRGSSNIRPQSEMTAALLSLITMLDPAIPINYGTLKPIRTVSREGLVVEAKYPAAVSSYFASMALLYSACLQALAPFNPGRAVGSSGFGTSGPVVGYKQARLGKPAVAYELMSPSLGGTPAHDGTVGINPMAQFTPFTPIEILENEFPVRIESFEQIVDSAGPGHRRGGTGYRKRYRVLVDATLNYRKAPTGQPRGVFGGKSPAPWRCTIRPGTDGEQVLRAAGAYDLQAGDVFDFQTQGGAGYGDPFTREPALVLEDVLNGYVSLEAAKRDYGVAIDPATMMVDEELTRALRGGP